MSWEHYRLLFRLESPLHIGWRKTGNLMQTRRYVPGKNLWAALTVTVVRMAGHGPEGTLYQVVGNILKENFRFGYLWPAHGEPQPNGSWKAPIAPHFPWAQTDPTVWDYLYLGSIARTARDSTLGTAAEATLHEVEYISSYTREGLPVYLVGDLWVREHAQSIIVHTLPSAPRWEAALARLQIGGERGYGWGRIRKMKCEKTPQSSPLSWGHHWGWKEANGEIVLSIVSIESTANADGKPIHLPAHALAVDFQEDFPEDQRALQGVQGAVEPWIGWERTPGKVRLSQVRILYVPGSRLPHGVARLILHPWGYLYASKADSVEGTSTN